MSKEIVHRFREGVSRNSAVSYHNQKKSALDLTPTGVPTFAPSISTQTANPTAVPTRDPTLSSTGYFYVTNSFSSDCSNPVVSVGFPVNTCLVDDSFAYRISIVNDDWRNAYIDYYGDVKCQQLLEGGIHFTEDEVKCQETDSVVVTNPANPNGKVFSQMFITTASTPPRINNAGGGLFEFFVGNTTCYEPNFESYLLYTSNVCLSNEKDAGAFYVDCSDGTKSVNLNVDSDSLPNCAGLMYKLAFPAGTCEGGLSADDDDDDDDYYTERNKMLPPPPSISTTPFPTSGQTTEVAQRVTCQASLKPTVPPAAFTFKVTKQVISDFSKAVYDSNPELYGLTLRQAIAATMQDVTASGITNMVVTATSARTTGTATSAPGAVRRALQTSSAVSVSYTVTGMSTLSAAHLAAQLQAALASGNFDTALHLLAMQNGAIGLLNASSSSAETDIEEDSDAPLLSTGAIIGVAIGGAAFLIIVGVLIWYFCSSGASTTAVTYNAAVTADTVATA
eukprot:gene12831-14812_t